MTHPLLKENADLATAVDILDSWVAHRVKQWHQSGLAIGLAYRGELIWGADDDAGANRARERFSAV